MPGSIVLYGATGVFGRLIAEDLLSRTDAPLVLTARRPAPLEPLARAHPSRVRLLASDANDPASAREALRGAAACILAVGPFQGISTAALEACVNLGVPYLDINDARAYWRAVHAMEERIRCAGVPVLTGLSTVPGLSGLCVAHAVSRFEQERPVMTAFDRAAEAAPLRYRGKVRGDFSRPDANLPPVDRVDIALLIGNRNRKGPGATASLLSTLGRAFDAIEDGRPVRRRVWGGRAAARFLPPAGTRVVRDVESPDYDLLPRRFGARTVRFQCGFDVEAGARGLEALALLRRVAGLDPGRWTGALLAAARLTAGQGAEVGALRIEVWERASARDLPGAENRGPEAPPTRSVVIQIASFDRGQRIAAIPAAVGARHLWEGRIRGGGVLPMDAWIRPEAFFDELRGRGFKVDVAGPAPCVCGPGASVGSVRPAGIGS